MFSQPQNDLLIHAQDENADIICPKRCSKRRSNTIRQAGLDKRGSCHTLRHGLRDAPVGGWLRYSDGAGTPRAQGRQYDYDLHACATARRARGTESAHRAEQREAPLMQPLPLTLSLVALQGCKRLFMYRTLIGFLRGDELRVEQAPQGVVQALHAEEGTAFEHAGDLVRFAFADKVGDSGLLISTAQATACPPSRGAVAADDATQGGQHGANARLLLREEDIDDAVDRCRSAIRMQCGEDEEARFRCGDSQAHGLQVTQLTRRMTSGSSRRAEWSAAAKLGVCTPTSRWLIKHPWR